MPIHKATKAQVDRAKAHSLSNRMVLDGWAHATMRDGDVDKATKPDHPAFATPSGSTDSGDPIPTDWQVSLEYRIQFINYEEGLEVPMQASFASEPTVETVSGEEWDAVLQAQEGTDFDMYYMDTADYYDPTEAGPQQKFYLVHVSDSTWTLF